MGRCGRRAGGHPAVPLRNDGLGLLCRSGLEDGPLRGSQFQAGSKLACLQTSWCTGPQGVTEMYYAHTRSCVFTLDPWVTV